jgi:hypothetical protein
MKQKKQYYLSKLSFIYTLIALSPILFIAIDSIVNIQKVVSIVMNLASLSMYFGLFTGIYSIFKIKQEKLKGIEFALAGTIICGLLFLLFIFSNLFSNLN